MSYLFGFLNSFLSIGTSLIPPDAYNNPNCMDCNWNPNADATFIDYIIGALALILWLGAPIILLILVFVILALLARRKIKNKGMQLLSLIVLTALLFAIFVFGKEPYTDLFHQDFPMTVLVISSWVLNVIAIINLVRIVRKKK